MAITLFKNIMAEGSKSTAALAINYTNAMVAAKVIAGASYLATRGSTNIGGVCVDTQGNVYLSDVTRHVIVKVTEGGEVHLVAGLAGTSGRNGTLTVDNATARFNSPRGLACDRLGNIYVADSGNNQILVIRGTKTAVVAGNGSGTSGFADGVGGAATFNSPYDIAVDAKGDLYVADRGNNSIRKITNGGEVITWAGSESGDGENCATTTRAIFNAPEGVDTDNMGNVYVADTGNDKLKKVIPRGWVYLLSGSTDGKAKGTTAFNSQFKELKGIAVDGPGNIYLIDRNETSGSRLVRVTPTGIVNVVFDTAAATTYDAALLGVAVNKAGKLFVVTDTTDEASSSSTSSTSSSSTSYVENWSSSSTSSTSNSSTSSSSSSP